MRPRHAATARLAHVPSQEHPAGIEPALPAWQAGRLPTTSWMPLAQKRCLELSSLKKCWSSGRLRVPDTFFGHIEPAVRLELTRSALRVRCAATRAPLAYAWGTQADVPRNILARNRTWSSTFARSCAGRHTPRIAETGGRRDAATPLSHAGRLAAPAGRPGAPGTSTRRRPSTRPPVRRSHYPSRESNPDLELRRLA